MNNNYETTVYESEKNMKNGKKFSVSIKFNRLAFGLLLIACAVLIILDACGVSLGFFNGVPAITLILGALSLLWMLSELVRLRISGIFFPLAFLFMLFEKHIAKWADLDKSNIINNWLVLLIALLLCIGTELIIPKRKKITYHSVSSDFSNNGSKYTKSTSKDHNASLGSSIVYIDCATFKHETVTNELGSCQVFFSNIEQYEGNGTLIVSNELGSMKINVPSEWRIVTNISNELGSVSTPQNEGNGEKILNICGDNELGSLSIVRV